MVKEFLLGNEAIALGAYHAGISVAAAYPGTPCTEILSHLARFKDIYTEWSTNEQVAMEVATGASYAGARALAAMKHVGLNVASDAFMAAAITGVKGGLVVVSADDPGIHSSQNEQDNRHYAELAKVPLLEPSDSQEAYDLMFRAFEISELFDTPVLLRSTTRISHSRTLVETRGRIPPAGDASFSYDTSKFVMLPSLARKRRPVVEERIKKLTEYSESFPFNRLEKGSSDLGIITSGIAYQYAREVFPDASFLKLGMSYPLPRKLIRDFASSVKKLLVVEELDPFMENKVKAMGIKVSGKIYFPIIGELNTDTVERGAVKAGLKSARKATVLKGADKLLTRPPLLCAGCPHSGFFFTLSTLANRSRLPGKKRKEPRFVITGDIGCYTLAAYPPLSAMDTCGCMGASIGQAVGMEKAGISETIVAVIGDSTFMHAGVTGLIDAVYNQSKITIVVLDNQTTAMTGHQGHPGTGISACGEQLTQVGIESLARGAGVRDVRTVDAFNLKDIRKALKEAMKSDCLSLIVVRGDCPTLVKKHGKPLSIDRNLCDDCGLCLMVGCPAIQKKSGEITIESAICIGDCCSLCKQLCPRKAIS